MSQSVSTSETKSGSIVNKTVGGDDPQLANSFISNGFIFGGGILLGIGLATLLFLRGGWLPSFTLTVAGGVLAAIGVRRTLQGWAAAPLSTHATTSAAPDVPALAHSQQVAFQEEPRPLSRPTPLCDLRVVAIGGGTGMPQLLRGLRTYTNHVTAIVTVADDGGSSGRLRRQMGMLPPGDFRNNIAALSDAEDLMTRLFQYRFAKSSDIEPGSELAGHSFGNLFIATMAAVTGSFEKGLAESSRVLAVRGRVLPSTLEQIHLCAEIRRPLPRREEATAADHDIVLVEGESRIPEAGGQVLRVFLNPADVRAYPAAIQAILRADLILAGPGSFFTSIMPNLLVPAIRDAICASSAPRIFICNVATQPGETDSFTVADHMHHLRAHAGNAFTTVLANRTYDVNAQPAKNSAWVTLPEGAETFADVQLDDYHLFTGDLVQDGNPRYHDSTKLASRVLEIYAELRSRQQEEDLSPS